ncbi:hypothetical protein REPUB_Repub13aG0137400 [Reevesia pubescens]
MTALEVFLMSKILSYSARVIEKDSKTAINWCRNEACRPWRYWEIFGQIDTFISEIGVVYFSNIHREVSSMADHLAKVGVHRSEMFMAWW